jgi:hypothetical protein
MRVGRSQERISCTRRMSIPHSTPPWRGVSTSRGAGKVLAATALTSSELLDFMAQASHLLYLDYRQSERGV